MASAPRSLRGEKVNWEPGLNYMVVGALSEGQPAGATKLLSKKRPPSN